MIRLAKDSDLPQLMDLWQEAFGDSAEDTAFYFEHRHLNENLLLDEQAGTVRGMLSMLPFQISLDGLALPARYVFAVATRKAFRGRGISTRLLEAAHQKGREEGLAATVLVPAEPSLFDYYQARGYQTAFWLDEITIPAAHIVASLPDSSLDVCGPDDYARIRNQVYADSRLFACWGSDALTYIHDSITLAGGQMVKIGISEQTACAVVLPDGEALQVLELAVRPADWETALALIARRFPAGNYIVRLQAGTLSAQHQRPFGMIHWLIDPPATSGSAPYLAFAKD